jgi:hypothetical protein
MHYTYNNNNSICVWLINSNDRAVASLTDAWRKKKEPTAHSQNDASQHGSREINLTTFLLHCAVFIPWPNISVLEMVQWLACSGRFCWSKCHPTSMTNRTFMPNTSTIQQNFLTTRKSGKSGTMYQQNLRKIECIEISIIIFLWSPRMYPFSSLRISKTLQSIFVKVQQIQPFQPIVPFFSEHIGKGMCRKSLEGRDSCTRPAMVPVQ